MLYLLLLLLMTKLNKYVIEFWFRRRFFEKDFDEVIVVAKSKKEALITFKNLRKKFYKIEKVTEILI